MNPKPQFSSQVAMVVGDVLGRHHFHHATLDTLFAEAGAPGEAPPGNCVVKCQEWLRRTAQTPGVDALAVLGSVLCKFMDGKHYSERDIEGQQRVLKVLSLNGFSYRAGGVVLGVRTAAPTRSLESNLRSHDLTAVNAEFERAISQVEKDPPGAVTAACAIVESLCKIIISDEGLAMPAKQDIGHLWPPVKQFLRVDPAIAADDDIKTLLGGLGTIVSGIGAFRTHSGSAHGRGREGTLVEPRHARLAVHAAHTLVGFILESWRPAPSVA